MAVDEVSPEIETMVLFKDENKPLPKWISDRIVQLHPVNLESILLKPLPGYLNGILVNM